MTVTLNQIRNNAKSSVRCMEHMEKVLSNLGKKYADDEPLSFITIFETIAIDDTIRILDALTGYDRALRLFAVWCARRVQHMMEDQRSLDAIDVAQRFAEGQATQEKLKAAWFAAMDARQATRVTEWEAPEISNYIKQNARDVALATVENNADDAARAASFRTTKATTFVGVAFIKPKTYKERMDRWAEVWEANDKIQIEEFLRLLTCIDSDKRYEI